jgi:hypothetical protein
VAEPGGAVLTGTMTCNYSGARNGYKIKVDLLR